MDNRFCCQCGEPRRPTQGVVPSFSYNKLLNVRDFRELKPGRAEQSPQFMIHLAVYASVRRNGGECSQGRTHMCEACIVVGLRDLKKVIDSTLLGLDGL